MFLFIIGLVLLITSIAWIAKNPTVRGEDGPDVPLGKLGWLTALTGVVLLVLSMLTIVGTRSVGVPTVFNKPTGNNLSAGLHVKAPWVKVNEVDGTIQPEEYKGDDCIFVKIADGGSACVSLAYRWRITEEGADRVFADYRNSDLEIQDAVRKAIVSTNIKAAINEVFGGYDPLSGAELSPDMTPEELASAKVNVVPDYEKINRQIRTNVSEKIKDVGDLVDIQSVTVSYVKLPDSTQDRINAFNKAVQNTKIALQEVATRGAQASGNRELAASLKDPNVLVSKCLDSLAAGEFTAPAGFSCWPGGVGSVVIPGTK